MQRTNYFSIVALIFMVLRITVSVENDSSCDCGRLPEESIEWRIVGGRRAVAHSHPWLVAVFYDERLDCGGSLITNKHVLGAGHCVIGRNKDAITVRIGMHQIDDEDVVVRKVDDIILHPDFVTENYRDDNDIAIYVLDAVVESTETILPICLPKEGSNYDDATAIVAGWGRLEENGKESNILNEVTVKVLSQQKCEQTGLKTYLSRNMICAYSRTGDGCQGDSGGPLVISNNGSVTQIGIVSWGIGCAHPDYPGVYTKVTNYLQWIKEVTGESVTCSI